MPHRYLQVDPIRGYPFGEAIFCECLRCGDVVASIQVGVAACRCSNVSFDIGRLDVEDKTRFRIFEEGGQTTRLDDE
jgi:hypothetical protein